MDTQQCLKQTKENMNSTVAFFDKELQKIRAGKASPQMLEGLKVDYYGNPTPVEQVAGHPTLGAQYAARDREGHSGCQHWSDAAK